MKRTPSQFPYDGRETKEHFCELCRRSYFSLLVMEVSAFQSLKIPDSGKYNADILARA